MEAEDILNKSIVESKKRFEVQQGWLSRIDSYEKSRRAFCQKHGLSYVTVCRAVNLDLLAGKRLFNKIELALKEEGL